MKPDKFRPKGPFPLFLTDFEKDTAGWSNDLRYSYLRLLIHLWEQGGFIPDDDKYLTDAMGMYKARGYHQKLDLIRTKLGTYPDSYADRKGLSIGKGLAGESRKVFQKRVLIELEKARKRSEIARNASKIRWDDTDANSINSEMLCAMPPTPTLTETNNQLDADEKTECYQTARSLFPDRDSGSLVTKLLQVIPPVEALAAIESARTADNPWQYLWGAWRKRKNEADRRAERAGPEHPADRAIFGEGPS